MIPRSVICSTSSVNLLETPGLLTSAKIFIIWINNFVKLRKKKKGFKVEKFDNVLYFSLIFYIWFSRVLWNYPRLSLFVLASASELAFFLRFNSSFIFTFCYSVILKASLNLAFISYLLFFRLCLNSKSFFFFFR